MVCRATRDDREMIRAGRMTDGRWYLGRGTGRGVWWCQGSECSQDLRASQVARALHSAASEADATFLRGLGSGSACIPQ